MLDSGKEVLDVAAGSTALLSMAAWLPPISSLFAIIWFAIRIFESDTVQGLLRNDKSD